jgi:CheY-like chemotaxis protein
MNIPELHGKTALVVDDAEPMRKVTTQLLRNGGVARVLQARDGNEALNQLAIHRVDIVLSDWNMPGMDGLELLRHIRSDARLRSLPFLMVTAEAARERVQRAIENGVSCILIKPYTNARLAEDICRTLKWRLRADVAHSDVAGQAKPNAAAQPAAPKAGGLLVVDDTPENLQLMVPLFSRDYRVRTATDGARAMAICEGNDPPDLVLLDIMMPGLSGFDVARKLREHPATEALPIIFVTAMDDGASRIHGLELGAVDFVSKPIEPEVLRLRVSNFMRYVALQKRTQGEVDALMEVARLRDEVDQITQHDLRGPLAGIASMTQLLLQDGLFSELERSYLTSIAASAHQALDMISLTSELYKIEAGQYELKAEPFDVTGMMRELADLTRSETRSHRITVSVSVPDETNPEILVLGDKVLTRSVFHNLLRNASEAAPPDTRIEISIKDGPMVEIRIKNRGAAPPAVRERFFDKYVTAGKRKGTGIGTYSAKRLTDAQGGAIAVQVDDQEDTTEITVCLPSKTAQSQAPVFMDLF